MTNRTKRGTFQAGSTGNAAGRPVGSNDAAKWRAALGADAGKVIGTVVRLAIAGDVGCCRLVMERCLPAYKPQDQAVPLLLPAGGTLTDQAAAMVTAMADGRLSPQAAAAMIGALANMVRVVETDEVLRRIENMEAHFGNKKPT